MTLLGGSRRSRSSPPCRRDAAASPAASSIATAAAFGIDHPQFRPGCLPAKRRTFNGDTTVRFQQTHEGVPVLAASWPSTSPPTAAGAVDQCETAPGPLSTSPPKSPRERQSRVPLQSRRERSILAAALHADSMGLWIYDHQP